MRVCICNGLTERDVLRAVRDGASTVAEVHRISRTAPMCGNCTVRLREILAKGTGASMGNGVLVPAATALPEMAGG